jgi:hypothetical protein
VLVTKRRQVASLGGHCVYKIEETAMLPIQSPNTRLESHPDEYKCVMPCCLVVLPDEYKRVFPAGAILPDPAVDGKNKRLIRALQVARLSPAVGAVLLKQISLAQIRTSTMKPLQLV